MKALFNGEKFLKRMYTIVLEQNKIIQVINKLILPERSENHFRGGRPKR